MTNQPRARLSAGKRLVCALCLVAPLLALPDPSPAAELHPFNTVDQSPLVQIYGLPAPESATVLPEGGMEARLAVDGANNNTEHAAGNEAILLDGESWRTTLSLRRGFGDRVEAGVEIPFVSQSGGVLDDFIEGWHRFFGLPQGGRDQEPSNRLRYVYLKDGREQLRYDDSHAGIGDVRLTGGAQLYREGGNALALRAALKLPTGDARHLTGSGSTDLSVWLTGQHDIHFERWGELAFFGSAGGLVKTHADVLSAQQRYLVAHGSLGMGWSPWRAVAFKVQLASHTPFYRASDLPELNDFSTLLLVGGTIAFSERTALDIGVSEDVLVGRSPDVSLHLALSRKF